MSCNKNFPLPFGTYALLLMAFFCSTKTNVEMNEKWNHLTRQMEKRCGSESVCILFLLFVCEQYKDV